MSPCWKPNPCSKLRRLAAFGGLIANSDISVRSAGEIVGLIGPTAPASRHCSI